MTSCSPGTLSRLCPGFSGAVATAPHLHLSLDPGPHDVGLAGELAAEMLIGLLLALLLQEGMVPLGHQLLHLGAGWSRSSQRAVPSPSPSPSPDRWHGTAHLLPLGVDDLGGDGGVGVAAGQFDVVAFRNPLGLLVDGQDGLPFPVGVRQRRLELVVG